MYDLSMMAKNKYVGRQIKDALGQTEKVDLVKGKMEWDEYMRVRVILDISKPLMRHKKWTIRDFDPI